MATFRRNVFPFSELRGFRWLSLILALLFSLSACNGGGSESAANSDPLGGISKGAYSEPVDYATAFRFLKQASFGPTESDLAAVMDSGIGPWLDGQVSMPSAYDSDRDGHLSHLQRLIEIAKALEPATDWFPTNESNDSGDDYFNGSGSSRTDDYQMSVWFENALNGPDQLRQRVAYALSQILVTSALDPKLAERAESLAFYYDILARNAFGNFRDLIGEVARSPAMGIYLSHQGNRRANPRANTLPDENFARELMQLFTIGLYELNLDGTPRRDGRGDLIPTYNQADIEEMAKVMTGWDLRYNEFYGRTDGSYVHPMEFSPEYHEFSEKQILGQTIPVNIQGGADLDAALDILFNHTNVGPFIGKQLIQRLVTSNPSPQYVARVAAVFNDNGSGVRGDLGAVVAAILLDEEARSASIAQQDYFGKANEPLLAYTALYRAFNVQPVNGWQPDAEAGSVPVDGIYYFRVQDLLGQGALRAPHVFNFYDPDYVPQDGFYRDSDPQRVLPEMQLRSPNNIASLFEALRLRANLLELNDLAEGYGSVAEYVAQRNTAGNWKWSRAIALLDFTPALQTFEMAMEGTANGDYSHINYADTDENGETPKQRGLNALLDFLELRLLGAKELPEEFRTAVVEHLDTASYFNTSGNATEREAIRVTAGAIQYVMLSSTNMALQ